MLEGAKAETVPGILAPMVEEKKRRVVRRRIESLSSLATKDWRRGEKEMCGGAIRILPVWTTSVWGSRIDDNRASPSIAVVAIMCG